MSSLASVPRRAASSSALTRQVRRVPRLATRREPLLAIALAALFALLAFTTAGAENLGADTWSEIVLVVVAAALGALAIVRGVRASLPGALAALAFVALTGLTALSIGWSVAPDQTWLEAARTAAYAGTFVAALVLARIRPGGWRIVAGGVAVAATVLSAWAILVKVLTLGVDGQTQYGRLLAPFGYWNATGLIAALGLPPLVWAASRRDRGRATRALAVPAITLLISVVVLSYSRSALAAAVLGVAVVLALTSTRLRATAALALGALGAVLICAWALSDGSLTGDRVSIAARTASGHAFGLVVVCVLALATALGFALAFQADRVRLSASASRRVGIGVLAALALIPLAGVLALATSSRGLGGEISHVWTTVTSSSSHVNDAPGRLVALANSRPRYWRQGLSVGEGHPLLGAGAGSFGVAHLRYPTALLTADNADHAHSYVIETFADLGALGLLLNLLLLLAWGLATRRALAGAGSWHGPRQDRATGETATQIAERDGLWALLGVVVAFGVSSALDWTWFYPGVAVPALFAAGWLAGRGPLGAARMPSRRPASVSTRPGAVLALTALSVAALACAWAIWQPLRSADSSAAGIAALTSGHPAVALADARAAVAEDPVALEPLQELHAIDRALGDRAGALVELQKATSIQPDNPLPWAWLGGYALHTHQPVIAERALRHAVALDVTDLEARRQLAAATQEASHR